MIAQKELKKLRANIANCGIGAKKRLAEFLEINPSNVTRYLKYGEIPDERLKEINKFISKNLS